MNLPSHNQGGVDDFDPTVQPAQALPPAPNSPPAPSTQSMPQQIPVITRRAFEIEANLRLIAAFATKDGISHIDAVQGMAQALTDALHRRGLFGDPTQVNEQSKRSGIVRYQAPRPRTRQPEQEVVAVNEQTFNNGGY